MLVSEGLAGLLLRLSLFLSHEETLPSDLASFVGGFVAPAETVVVVPVGSLVGADVGVEGMDGAIRLVTDSVFFEGKVGDVSGLFAASVIGSA